MPLSSSYHDFSALHHPSIRQRSVPGSGAAASPSRTSARYGLAQVAPSQRQPSPEAQQTGASRIVLGTASIASQRGRDPSRSLPLREVSHTPPPTPSLPVPHVVPAASTTEATSSPPVPPPPPPPRRVASLDNRSTAASSHQPRRTAQPPSFHTTTGGLTTAVAVTEGTRSASVSAGARRDAPTTTITTTTTAAPLPSSSPRLAHLRPLTTSREADYLNLAAQRAFTGRFRCAVPVVVCTSAALTSHEVSAAAKRRAARAGTASVDPRAEEQESHDNDPVIATLPAPLHVEATQDDATGDGAALATARAISAAGPRTRTGGAAGAHGSSALTRPRLSVSGSTAASVVSGGTARRGRTAGQQQRPPSASASVTASSLPRRSLRSTTLSMGLRNDPAGITSATAAASSRVPAANMEPLVQSGLHTSLWLAAQDGGLEVRSLANPSQVLASVPRRDARAIITALAAVCGNRVVAGHTDGSLHLYDTVTLQEVGECRVHTAAVTRLHYVSAAPRGAAASESSGSREPCATHAVLLAGSLDRTITVWAASSMTLLHRLKGNTRGVSALAATSTGGYAFSGSDDGTIRMWDLVQGTQWGVTKDERAQLTKRARDVLVSGGDTAIEYSTSESDSDDSRSDDDEDLPEDAAAVRGAEPRGSGPKLPGSPHRRPVASVGYGGVKAVPRVAAVVSRGTRTIHRPTPPSPAAAAPPLPQRHPRGTAGQPGVSSRSLQHADDAFAPTDTATTSSPMRDGDGFLAGISPLRTSLAVDGAAAAVAGRGSHDDAVARLAYGEDGDLDAAPAPARKTKAKKKKAGHRSAAGAAGEKGRKAKEKGNAAEPGKRKKVKKAKKASRATQAAPAVRLPPSALEQRLDTWLRLYQQRVLFSAASYDVVAQFPAGYDRASAVNWPIDCAHIEYVTALTVVEDRLLVSASCDATAKVFALPSGQYLRTLTSARRMPLSSVLYASAVRRIYTAFSDGAVAVYDLSSPELPLLSQLQSPQTILSCTFASIALAPMHRFVLNAHVDTAAAEASGAVTAVAQFDKTTQAHGPNQTVSSYKVGQPSLRELNAAVSLVPVQQQRAADLVALAKRGAATTVEEVELRSQRRCALVLLRSHARRQAGRVLTRWQLWTQRRAALRALAHVAAAHAQQAADDVRGRYWVRWLHAARQRRKADAAGVLRRVQLQGSDAVLLRVSAETRAGKWHAMNVLAAAMARALRVNTMHVVYRRWRDFQRTRQSQLRQSISLNTLLLSMNAGAETPSCCALEHLSRSATRRAHHAKALWLLSERTAQWQARQLRRHVFARWRSVAQERHRERARHDEAWHFVEPLSSTLAQPQLLRRRYFALWRNFALYVARVDQLTSERETLQGEWATLQRAVETPATVGELKRELAAATTATAATAAERVALAERVQSLSDEDSTLRTEEALRVLIRGYYVPDVATTAAVATTTAAIGSAPSARADAPPLAAGARHTPRASSVSSSAAGRTRLKNSAPPRSAWKGEEEVEEGGCAATEAELRDRKLLVEVGAVLRALKGNCMQCARDDKLMAKAHALAVRLPILEPLSPPLSVSVESSPSRRHGNLPAQRSTTWSVSTTKNGASTTTTAAATPTLSSQQQQSQQRRRPSTLSGSHSSLNSATTPTTSATTAAAAGRPSSAAQMWAAQPAEESYASLADAFNAIYAGLTALLYTAAMNGGVGPSAASRTAPAAAAAAAAAVAGAAGDVHNTGLWRGRGSVERGAGAEVEEGLQAPALTPSWLAQVPLKQRRVMVGEVLKLVTLFDSFAAHSDLPVERAGSISMRGVANTRALPLASLCTRETAQSLLRHAAVLLELVDPQLWPRQVKLNYLQDAYAAAIAELNATVTSSHLSDAAPNASTIMTRSESEDQEGSPSPTPLVMRPPALCLSAEVLQHAAARLQPPPSSPGVTRVPSSHLGGGHTPTTASGSDGPPTRASALRAAPHHPALLLTNFAPYTAAHGSGSDEKLNSTIKSVEEEGQTSTPDPQHAHSSSFSHRTFSAVSTPRSYTPRTATSSVANASTGLLKPYLGFRVNVTRDAQAARRTATTICIRDVAPRYVNAEGVEVDGPALLAGLQADDQLVRFAGYAVTDLAAFNAVVSRHVHSGAELPVVVQRGEELLSTTIVVGTRMA